MRVLPTITLLAYALCSIPITQQLKSKFKLTNPDSSEASESKHQQSTPHQIQDKVIHYNKLGTKSDLIINQVKAKEADASFNAISDESEEDNFVIAESEKDNGDSTVSLPVDYKLHCTKSYVESFVNFKNEELTQLAIQDDKLPTSIKNYGDSLNHPDNLRLYTSKIIQERVEDTDFNDYNFKKYGTKEVPTITQSSKRLNFNPKMEMAEFVNYLVKFEGFKRDDLKFLLKQSDLNYGLEEIDKELDKIKHIQDERERIIEIGGEFSAAGRLMVPSMIGLCWCIIFFI